MPKALRDALQLQGGTRVEMRAEGGKLEIEPVPTSMRLVHRGKGLVATTDEPLPAIDADDMRAVTESIRRDRR